MKNKIYLLIVLSIILGFSSCSNEGVGIDEQSVIKVHANEKSELDKWIYENYTVPYNIEVKYKWDDTEVDNKAWVVPPKTEKAKEFLEAMLKVWIQPYVAEAGEDFIKQYIPKLLVLIGSPQYNKDGTMTLGLAEGGRKVSIFDVNSFAEVNTKGKTPEQILKAKKRSIIESFHTMHHEFAHILHQTKFYPIEFKAITKGKYTGNWKDVSDDDANILGYITPYSMLNEDEDFVEIVAAILTSVQNSRNPVTYDGCPAKDKRGILTGESITLTLSEWDIKLYLWGIGTNSAGEWIQLDNAEKGLDLFNRKVLIVTSYFKNKWGVDLYNLQKRIDEAVDNITK